MSETWGELIAEAEFHVRRARTALLEPFSDIDTARQTALAHNDVLRGLHANLHVLDPSSDPPYAHILDADLTQLGRLVAEVAPTSRRDMNTTSEPWHQVARCLHVAGDLLGSHLGPDRAHRTPDAILFDDPAELGAAITTMAELSETTADASSHLALRVHEIALRHDAVLIDAWARGAVKTAATIKAAASNVAARSNEQTSTSRFMELQSAPLLRLTMAEDPIVSARQSFDRIRLIAHRQARGELKAGVDTLRALAHVGVLASIHTHAIFAAAATKTAPDDADRLTRTSQLLSNARHSWASIDAAVSGCVSITRSPQLLIQEAETLNASLTKLTLSPDHGGWLTPENILKNPHHATRVAQLAEHITERLSDLSRSTSAIADRLDRAGVLLVPTRERDDIDHPYRWAPLSVERRDAIRTAVKDAANSVRNIGSLRPKSAPQTRMSPTLSPPLLPSPDTIQRHTAASSTQHLPPRPVTY